MIEQQHFDAIIQCLTTLHFDADQLVQGLRARQPIGTPTPDELSRWLNRLGNLRQVLKSVRFTFPAPLELSAHDMSLVRTGVALLRRQQATEAERAERYFHSASIRRHIGQNTRTLDDLLTGDLVSVVPAKRPRLGHYLTIEGLEQSMAFGKLGERERDPKHRILLSSSLLNADLALLRAECEQRAVSLGILFVDLDSFKAINTALGEVVVDRTVLPQVLSRVEAVAFGHGYAYRFGGDEFVLILLNTSEQQALLVARALSDGIAALEMPSGASQITASIGVWIADNESHLTESELVQMASEAKQRAKDLGRRRIVMHIEEGSGYRETLFPAEARLTTPDSHQPVH